MDNDAVKISDRSSRLSYIQMLITPYGRFLGKKLDDNTLKEAAEIFNIHTDRGIQAVLAMLGTLTVHHLVPTVWVDIDSKSALYAEYFKASSGLMVR